MPLGANSVYKILIFWVLFYMILPEMHKGEDNKKVLVKSEIIADGLSARYPIKKDLHNLSSYTSALLVRRMASESPPKTFSI